MRLLHPQLLAGAWSASAPRLAQLISVYDLTTKLAVAYGRIEELRWRLRHRTAHRDTALDEPTSSLVNMVVDEVKGLIERVEEQIVKPDVQPFGLQHRLSLGTAYENPPVTDTAIVHGAESSSGRPTESGS